MKLIDMQKILRDEFPGRFVSFEINVNKYADGSSEVKVSIYDGELHAFFKGKDFNDCVRILKAIVSKTPAEKTKEIEF